MPNVIQLQRAVLPGAGRFVGALDGQTSGAVDFWSVNRRVLGSHTGALIRVRADRTGQPELDFGVTANGFLDTSGLLSFAGSSSCFVVRVYGQANGIDMVQSTTTRQMRIVNAGTLETLNGRPAMRGETGAGTHYLAAVSGVNLRTNLTALIAAQYHSDPQAYDTFWGTNGAGAGNLLIHSNSSATRGVGFTQPVQNIANSTAALGSNPFVLATRATAGSFTVSSERSSGQVGTCTGSVVNSTGTVSSVVWGSSYDNLNTTNVAWSIPALFSEFTLWSTDLGATALAALIAEQTSVYAP